MKNFFKKRLEKMLSAEQSVHKLAFSTAVGMAVAFSPFLGLQTVLLLGLGMIMRLNVVVAMTVLYLVNNPLTMFPILAFDYVAGVWLSSSLLGITCETVSAVPVEHNWFVQKIISGLRYCGVSGFDLWGFLIGGTLIAIVIGIVTYPGARILFKYLIAKFPIDKKS